VRKIENNEKKTVTCRQGVTWRLGEESEIKRWQKERATRIKNKGKEGEIQAMNI